MQNIFSFLIQKIKMQIFIQHIKHNNKNNEMLVLTKKSVNRIPDNKNYSDVEVSSRWGLNVLGKSIPRVVFNLETEYSQTGLLDTGNYIDRYYKQGSRDFGVPTEHCDCCGRRMTHLPYDDEPLCKSCREHFYNKVDIKLPLITEDMLRKVWFHNQLI